MFSESKDCNISKSPPRPSLDDLTELCPVDFNKEGGLFNLQLAIVVMMSRMRSKLKHKRLRERESS